MTQYRCFVTNVFDPSYVEMFIISGKNDKDLLFSFMMNLFSTIILPLDFLEDEKLIELNKIMEDQWNNGTKKTEKFYEEKIKNAIQFENVDLFIQYIESMCDYRFQVKI